MIVGLAGVSFAIPARAIDQTKAIINTIDPKSMNELFDMAQTQRDAALTNVTPLPGNRFRFLFIWPSSNPVMTFDRIGRSFAERLIKFAGQQVYLTNGYCLLTKNMLFGTTTYGTEGVNVAYRDIEVRYIVGPKTPCPGRYIEAAELNLQQPAPPQAYKVPTPTQQQPGTSTPLQDLKPFLKPDPTTGR